MEKLLPCLLALATGLVPAVGGESAAAGPASPGQLAAMASELEQARDALLQTPAPERGNAEQETLRAAAVERFRNASLALRGADHPEPAPAVDPAVQLEQQQHLAMRLALPPSSVAARQVAAAARTGATLEPEVWFPLVLAHRPRTPAETSASTRPLSEHPILKILRQPTDGSPPLSPPQAWLESDSPESRARLTMWIWNSLSERKSVATP